MKWLQATTTHDPIKALFINPRNIECIQIRKQVGNRDEYIASVTMMNDEAWYNVFEGSSYEYVYGWVTQVIRSVEEDTN